MAFVIGQNDTWPPIQATLKDAAAAAVNLTGASVKFTLKQDGGSVTVNEATATILSAAAGTVEYAWATGDTASAGTYQAEWEVTFSTGKIATFPNTIDKIVVTINPELA